MAVDFFQVELTNSFPLAIPLEQTAEVLSLQWSELCPIPGITEALLGVSNQRGRLLWMVDIAVLLGLNPGETVPNHPEKSTAIVFTKAELRVAGVVSALKGIISLETQNLQSHPHPCLRGQTQLEEQPLHVLDVDGVFKALQEPGILGIP